MATIGRTLLRLMGAVFVGASATKADNPGLLFAPTAPQPRAPERRAPTVEGRIAPWKRVYTLRIDHVTNRDVIRPTSRVHVLAVMNDPERHQVMGKLIMPNVWVLAIDSEAERLSDGRPTKVAVAAVELTLWQAERLSIAAARGPLDLVLGVDGDEDSFAVGYDMVTPLYTPPAKPRR